MNASSVAVTAPSFSTRNAVYWTATLMVGFVCLSGGASYLAGAEWSVQGVADLGYPRHFVTFLGTCKLLGGLALLAPGLPRLKEWAYAGITLNLVGAAVAHVANGDPLVKAAVPLVILGIVAVSWALRPASRTLRP